VKQGQESFCSLPCHQGSRECPRVADCKDVGGGDFQCVHRSGSCVGTGAMCQPCTDDPDCQKDALCLTFSFSKESFCATSCSTKGQSCEGSPGYRCEAIGTASGSVNQCVPYNKDPTKDIFCTTLSPTMEVGDTLPDFAMVGYLDEAGDGSLKGEKLRVVKLSDLSSSSIILFNVAAGWCSPCQQETKGMAALFSKYHASGLAIFQVLYDGDEPGVEPTKALLDRWISLLNAQGACGIDPDRDVAPYNTSGTTPLNMLLDAKTRKVLTKWNGVTPPGFPNVEAAVQKALGL